MATTLSRAVYADMFGPTTGDRLRLADTELIIEVERDFTTYGEEVKLGGGQGDSGRHGTKVNSPAEPARSTPSSQTRSFLDFWGIVKADIGPQKRSHRRHGKAGNPDIQPNVSICEYR